MNNSLNVKNMKLSTLVFIMYGFMCAGSFGVETMVGTSGPGVAFLGLLIVPLLWGTPIALISAELGAAYPEEGGAYVWAKKALGPFWAYLLGAARTVYFWVAGGGTLALAMSYLMNFLHVGRPIALLLMAILIFGCGMVNLIGLDVVGISSKVFAVLISVPFLLVAIFALFKLEYNPFDPMMNPENTTMGNIGYMFALGIWMYGGWENAASMAGEIKNFSKIFPKALFITMFFMILTYALPNILGLAAVGHWELWGGEMDMVTVANIVVGPIGGIFMLIAAIFSNLILFIGGISHNSRNPLVLAQDNMFPKFFGKVHKKYKTPTAGIFAMCIVSMGGCFFDFETIVTFLLFLTFAMTTIYFLCAFILRIKEPNKERPFKVPGGKVGICILFIPILALSIYSIIGNGISSLIGFVAIAILLPTSYFIFKKMYGGYKEVGLEATATQQMENDNSR